MRTLITLLSTHAVLLALASTRFSIISWLWGDVCWNWSYFQYAYRNGFGFVYVSDHSLAQVLCYIAAYGVGAVALGLASLRHHVRLGGFGTLLCVVSTVSFTIELTHWLWRHNFSWIASFPAVMVALWVVVGVQLARRGR